MGLEAAHFLPRALLSPAQKTIAQLLPLSHSLLPPSCLLPPVLCLGLGSLPVSILRVSLCLSVCILFAVETDQKTPERKVQIVLLHIKSGALEG